MYTISQTAIEQVIRDIRNGVVYPDLWPESDENAQPVPAEQQGKAEEKPEEKKAAQA